MEIDLDLEQSWLVGAVSILVSLIVMLGLAGIGQRATPVTPLGEPRVITWTDWNVLQLKREHTKEISALRKDVEEAALLLQLPPDPIAAQVLYRRVHGSTSNGLASTATARTAALEAAESVVRWSTGELSREKAIAKVERAIGELK